VKAIEKLVVVGDNIDGIDNAFAMSLQLGALAKAAGISEIVVQDADGVYLDLAQLTSANTVTGGAGNDSIAGFAGADSLDGGTGSLDTLFLNATSTDLNRATDIQLVNIEVINASNSTSGVQISLNSQSDNLQIVGSSSADSIIGGSGADSLTGGAGADNLTGGAGADNFTYSASSETGNLSTGAVDVLSDFSAAADFIKGFGTAGNSTYGSSLPEYTEASITSGSGFASALSDANAVFAASGGQNYYFTSYGSVTSFQGALFIDADGNGTADGAIKIGSVQSTHSAAMALLNDSGSNITA